MSALEREIEETRERLASTIDQLVYRAHPKTIVGREVTTVKAHFVDRERAPRAPTTSSRSPAASSASIALFVVVRKVAAEQGPPG